MQQIFIKLYFSAILDKELPGGTCFVAEMCPMSVTLWTIALQSTLSMRFFRQEYWMGCHFLLQGGIPNPWVEPASPVSLTLQDNSLPTEPSGKTQGGA